MVRVALDVFFLLSWLFVFVPTCSAWGTCPILSSDPGKPSRVGVIVDTLLLGSFCHCPTRIADKFRKSEISCKVNDHIEDHKAIQRR